MAGYPSPRNCRLNSSPFVFVRVVVDRDCGGCRVPVLSGLSSVSIVRRRTDGAGPVFRLVWPCGSPVALGGPAHNPTDRPFSATPPHGGSLLFQKNRRLYHPGTQSHFQKQNRTRTYKGPMRRVAVLSHTPATRQVVSFATCPRFSTARMRGKTPSTSCSPHRDQCGFEQGKMGSANRQNGGWELGRFGTPAGATRRRQAMSPCDHQTPRDPATGQCDRRLGGKPPAPGPFSPCLIQSVVVTLA